MYQSHCLYLAFLCLSVDALTLPRRSSNQTISLSATNTTSTSSASLSATNLGDGNTSTSTSTLNAAYSTVAQSSYATPSTAEFSVNPSIAFPASSTSSDDASWNQVTFATTCCPTNGAACYNQLAIFNNRITHVGFFALDDAQSRSPDSIQSRTPDATESMCTEAHSTCDWATASFDSTNQYGQVSQWNLAQGLLDRNHQAPASVGSFKDVGNTMYTCLAADLSILYYDNGTPCVADIACQAPPSGGVVSGVVAFDETCGFSGAQPNWYAKISVYYPGGTQLLCEDAFSNIAYHPGKLTSAKCNTEIEMDGHGGAISINYATYANGYTDYTQRSLAVVETDGDCDQQEYGFSFIFDGQNETF